jgi:hypothetical protein
MRSMFAINGIYTEVFLIGVIYLGFIFGEKWKWTRVMGLIAIFWAAWSIWAQERFWIHRCPAHLLFTRQAL